MKRRLFIPFVLMLLLMGIGVPAALAAPDQPGQDTIVESGEVVNNNIILTDGDLEVHEGAVVNGDVVLFNGDAYIDGRVNGSLTLFNGSLNAGEGAAISGDCVLLNGQTRGDVVPGNCTAIENLNLNWGALAAVLPQIFEGIPTSPAVPVIPGVPAIPTVPAVPAVPAVPDVPNVPTLPLPPKHVEVRSADSGGGFFRGVAELAGLLLATVFMGFAGLLSAAIAPDNLRQLAAVTRRKPVTSGAAGALTAIAVPSLIVLLIPLSIILTFVCIGLLGFPLILLLAFGLVAGAFLGWIGVGTALGDRFFNRSQNKPLATTAALGTGALTFGVGLLGLLSLDFLSGLAFFIISAVGLGAVALTQFGRKPYPRRSEPGAPVTEDPIKVEEVLLTLAPDEIGDIATEK